MAWLNLYELFVNLTFGSVGWALLGLIFIIVVISYFGRWTTELRIVYIVFFLYVSMWYIQPIYAALFFIAANIWFVVGVASLIKLAR